MLDERVDIEVNGWKYWVRLRDGQVTNVQGYNNFHSNVQGDRYGVTVTNSSQAISRVFVSTPSEEIVLNFETSDFAAAPGNMLRFSSVGPFGKMGVVRDVHNRNNGSWHQYTNWKDFLPPIRRYILLMVAWLFVASTCVGLLAHKPKPGQDFDLWVQQNSIPIGIVVFAVTAILAFVVLRRSNLRGTITMKIDEVLGFRRPPRQPSQR